MNFTYVALILSLFASALAEADQNAAKDDLAMAERTLKVDSIHDGHVIEVLDTSNKFAFTYCRKGSPSLSKHTVVSTGEPDATFVTSKVVYDMVIELDSKQCRAAS